MTQFESALVKRITEEIDRLKDEAALGAFPDWLAYKEFSARVFAYRRVIEEFIPDVNTELAKR